MLSNLAYAGFFDILFIFKMGYLRQSAKQPDSPGQTSHGQSGCFNGIVLKGSHQTLYNVQSSEKRSDLFCLI